jgi:hypothetical protein
MTSTFKSLPSGILQRIVFCILIGFAIAQSSKAQPAFLKNGLVAYYPFNGNAIDESGNKFNGTVIGAVSSLDRFGKINSAFRFNGKDSKITVPNFPVNGTGITLSFWYNVSEPNVLTRFLSHNWDLNLPLGSFCADAQYGGVFRGRLDSDIVGLYLRKPLPTNSWQHWVLTFDGAKTCLYTNGSLARVSIQPNSLRQTTATLHIGGQHPLTILNGSMDDVRIYNRSLTENEVREMYLYESRPAFTQDGLVAYYPFNGNPNDESGHHNDGISHNLSLTSDRFGNRGSAFGFDGLTSYIQVKALNFEPPTTEGTISIWVHNMSNPSRYAFVVGQEVEGDAGYLKLQYNASGNMTWYTRWGTAVQKDVTPQGRWTHYLGTCAKGTNRLYIDGVLVSSNSDVWNIDYRSSDIFIGKLPYFHPTEGYLFFKGSLDDVRVYNRALSSSEAQALYKYESTPNMGPPEILLQPQPQVVFSGDDVSLCINLKDFSPYNYQWQRNEQNISGATSSCYNINSATSAANGGRYRVIVSNSAGTVISDSVTLTVNNPPPPVITTQPESKTVQEGINLSLSIGATGKGTLVYQWQFNEQNISGATSATLNLTGLKPSSSGRYRVLVSSQYGVSISDTAVLIVNANPPPTIVTQPVGKTPSEGTQLVLSVTASGVGTLTYQWQLNQQNIPGATSSSLLVSAVRSSANGRYRVIVGNQYGTTVSTEVAVTVVVTDSDSDGLSDYEEILSGTNPTNPDSDGDGLNDFAEVKTYGSNPLTTDTDGDGYSDGIEVARDGNPKNPNITPTGALAIFPAVDVEFYTLTGVKYQLEVSTDMTQWTPQGGVVVGNGNNQNHLVRASKVTSFWRLKVVQ